MIEEKIDILTKLKFCEKEVITTYGQVSDSSFQLFLFKKKEYIEVKKMGVTYTCAEQMQEEWKMKIYIKIYRLQ